MGQFLLRRLAISVPVLIGITLATYIIINLAPGDPVTALISPEAAASLGPEWVAQQRQALGLDKPLPVRYVLWLRETARGNLGFSLVDRQPIGKEMRERLWPTFRLMGTALLLSLLIAVPVGVLSALRQYSALDYIVTVGWLRGGGDTGVLSRIGGDLPLRTEARLAAHGGHEHRRSARHLRGFAQHLVLPATVLGLAEAAPLIRYVR